MLTKNVKNSESGILEAGDPLLAVEIGTEGIQRVLVFHADGDEIDEQTAAHLLLAKVMAQLMFLDDALKSEGGSLNLEAARESDGEKV
jgi:hypothetical protein